MDKKTLYYAAAHGWFEEFLGPYAFFALSHDPTAIVEYAVVDPENFSRENADLLSFLELQFPGRLTVSRLIPLEAVPRASRFVNTPTRADEATYIYIADIDVLILDPNLTSTNVANMDALGTVYSNIVRSESACETGYPRMIGRHFTRRDAYYPLPDLSSIDLACGDVRGADEHVLYQLVRASGAHIATEATRAGIHGIHMTPSRRPFGSYVNLDSNNVDLNALTALDGHGIWEGIENPEYCRRYLDIWHSEAFQHLYFLLTTRMQQRLLTLAVICKNEYPAWQRETVNRLLSSDVTGPAIAAKQLYNRLKRSIYRKLPDTLVRWIKR